MEDRSNQSGHSNLPAGRGRGLGMGWLGLFLFPIAALIYLALLPFFGVLWLLEFFLPRHPDEPAPHADLPEDAEVQFPGHGGQEFKLR